MSVHRVLRQGDRLPAIFKPTERLIDALTDPARRERVVLIVLAVYAVVWTLYGVVAKSSQDMQFDAAELVGWSQHLALGYTKHPPFAAWVVHLWFMVFPIRDWTYYLLAMTYAAIGLWVAWRLFERFLDPEKRVVALACLMLVPYFNFHGLRFDHNAILGPLWAATIFFYIRSYDTRGATWAALAGAAAATAMLGKYWSIFMLAGLALAALTDARRAAYFRSAAPWITIATGALCLAPHLAWLATHDFISFAYALEAHPTTRLHSVKSAADYLAGGVGYAAAPVLMVVALTRPSRAAIADMLLPRAPERRFAAAAMWTALLLPAAVGLVFDFELNSIWTMSDFILLPVVLLSSPLLILQRRAVVMIAAVAVALPFVMLAAAPAIAVAQHVAGVKQAAANGKLLAARIEQEWRKTTDRPLRIVGGDFDLANVTAFYLPGQPSAFPLMEPETAPWVTPARIAREGIALTCHLDEPPRSRLCNDNPVSWAIDRLAAGNPAARRLEAVIARTYWGIRGEPVAYLIVIVPPRP